MAWNLKEEEVAAIMDAVRDVLEPWLWVDPDASFKMSVHKDMGLHKEGDLPDADNSDYYTVDIQNRMQKPRPDAPAEIVALDRVYMNILDGGGICIGTSSLRDCCDSFPGQTHWDNCPNKEEN